MAGAFLSEGFSLGSVSDWGLGEEFSEGGFGGFWSEEGHDDEGEGGGCDDEGDGHHAGDEQFVRIAGSFDGNHVAVEEDCPADGGDSDAGNGPGEGGAFPVDGTDDEREQTGEAAETPDAEGEDLGGVHEGD